MVRTGKNEFTVKLSEDMVLMIKLKCKVDLDLKVEMSYKANFIWILEFREPKSNMVLSTISSRQIKFTC